MEGDEIMRIRRADIITIHGGTQNIILEQGQNGKGNKGRNLQWWGVSSCRPQRMSFSLGDSDVFGLNLFETDKLPKSQWPFLSYFFGIFKRVLIFCCLSHPILKNFPPKLFFLRKKRHKQKVIFIFLYDFFFLYLKISSEKRRPVPYRCYHRVSQTLTRLFFERNVDYIRQLF